MTYLLDLVHHIFMLQFNSPPACIVRAPGRVNLIGEHTDYNDGFVLPMAIDHAVWIALQPRSDRKVIVQSLDFADSATFDLDNLVFRGPPWIEYAKGVASELQNAGYALSGWEGVLAGDVPIGAGLASSAALELAVTRAFCQVSDFRWNALEIALICQRAENAWMGVNCGIMDQIISASGKAGCALLIDCRTLETSDAPLPQGTAVVVLDTSTRRGLVDSAYNERRAQCEAAARFFGVQALRDVSPQTFLEFSGSLDELTRRRARHVILENQRTLDAAAAMQIGDVSHLGNLMNESHTSLRDDFQVSSRELDIMVAMAQEHPACYGARMTGAGFGGCAVALVEKEGADAFCDQVGEAYIRATGIVPHICVCSATDGASSYAL